MSKQYIQGWAISSRELASGEALYYQSGWSIPVSGWLRTLLFWVERSHQRKALGELAELNDYLLKDIGLTRDEALREAEKPFWR